MMCYASHALVVQWLERQSDTLEVDSSILSQGTMNNNEYTETELLALQSEKIAEVHNKFDRGELETVVPDDLP